MLSHVRYRVKETISKVEYYIASKLFLINFAKCYNTKFPQQIPRKLIETIVITHLGVLNIKEEE